MANVFLGLGSNVGDKKKNIGIAFNHLEKKVSFSKLSPFYETEPVGYENQEWFVNVVMQGFTSLSPQELLTFVKKIEKDMGRTPTKVNGPRLIDIDILLYDDQIINTPDLVIPHPSLHKRLFVLRPLEDIAPTVIHPLLKKSVSELKKELKNPEIVRALT